MTATTKRAADAAAAVKARGADVEAARAELINWRQQLRDEQERLTQMESRSGTEIAAAPELVDELAMEIPRCRARIELVGRAIGAAEGQVAHAERLFFAAEATRVRVTELAAAEAALAAHKSKVAALVEQLKDLEGVAFVPGIQQPSIDDLRANGPITLPVLQSQRLAGPVGRARLRVQVAEMLAAGEDPATFVAERVGSLTGLNHEDLYTAATWGPAAVVPAPEYVRLVERARTHLEDLEASIAARRQELAKLEDVGKRGRLPVWVDGMELSDLRRLPGAVAHVEEIVARLEAQRVETQAQLSQLEGAETPAIDEHERVAS